MPHAQTTKAPCSYTAPHSPHATCRAIADVMAGPDSQSSLHTGMHSLVESYLDVLTRVLLAQPEAFTNIISGGPQAHERFLDNWIHVASVRCDQGAASAGSHRLGVGVLWPLPLVALSMCTFSTALRQQSHCHPVFSG